LGANQAHFVQSHDTGLVLDVDGGHIKGGSKIILWNKKHGNDAFNQKWVIDQHGFIHLNENPNFVLDIEGGGGAGTKVILWERKHHDNANQKWRVDGPFIVSQANGLVLDVDGGSHKAGAHLIVWERKHHNNENQKWSFVH